MKTGKLPAFGDSSALRVHPDAPTRSLELPAPPVARDVLIVEVSHPWAVAFLDRIRALAMKLDRLPSPGYLTALREALGLT